MFPSDVWPVLSPLQFVGAAAGLGYAPFLSGKFCRGLRRYRVHPLHKNAPGGSPGVRCCRGDERQNRTADGVGKVRPSLDQRAEVGVAGNCTGFCTALPD
ncbi:MAG: hypothetical protein FJ304_26185 [Planctomycetes bacterium]|nr:hypothetical protein [Planctomycetota bacterium]